MTTFLTIAVVTEAVAIAVLWVAVRLALKRTVALADLARKTLAVTDALGGVDQSIISAICPAKSRNELQNMN